MIGIEYLGNIGNPIPNSICVIQVPHCFGSPVRDWTSTPTRSTDRSRHLPIASHSITFFSRRPQTPCSLFLLRGSQERRRSASIQLTISVFRYALPPSLCTNAAMKLQLTSCLWIDRRFLILVFFLLEDLVTGCSPDIADICL